jgi:hypothetical protein
MLCGVSNDGFKVEAFNLTQEEFSMITNVLDKKLRKNGE